MRPFRAMLLPALLGLSLSAGAETPGDPEELLDGALRMSGYMAGQAFKCTEGSKQPALESEVLRRAAAIDRLLGGDRAFFYAASFGAGSTNMLDRSQCEQYLKDFWARKDAPWTGQQR